MHDGCLYIICGYNSAIDQHFNCLWRFNPGSYEFYSTFGVTCLCLQDSDFAEQVS